MMKNWRSEDRKHDPPFYSIVLIKMRIKQPQLPVPDQDALEASATLMSSVVQYIQQHDNWISFAQYMEQVLYTPSLGYYSGGATKLGQSGDFTTAPLITSLFGRTLATVIAAIMQQTTQVIYEFGAGSGKLAKDILDELKRTNQLPDTYYIIELSGQLRAQQQQLLVAYPMVKWLDQLPDEINGCVIGNEVLDAMPVQLVVKTAQGWMERGVSVEDNRFMWMDRSIDQTLVNAIPDAELLPVGYVTELHRAAEQFMQTISSLCAKGKGSAAIWIDYGFPAHEYYLHDRHMGTLMCHYRHFAHDDPFYLPGLQDITAHVNFSLMAYTAFRQQLDVLWYGNQASFLLGAGIGEQLLAIGPDNHQTYLPESRAVQKLISPAEMGELFKVLVIGHQVTLSNAIMHYDRTDRL